MRLFMFRWPNGDTTIVGAPSKDEALLFVDDEYDDPFQAEISELKHFAIDLKPVIENATLQFECSVPGDEEQYDIRPRAYPLLCERFDAAAERDEDVSEEVARQSLEEEKERVKTKPLCGQSPIEIHAGWTTGGMVKVYERAGLLNK